MPNIIPSVSIADEAKFVWVCVHCGHIRTDAKGETGHRVYSDIVQRRGGRYIPSRWRTCGPMKLFRLVPVEET